MRTLSFRCPSLLSLLLLPWLAACGGDDGGKATTDAGDLFANIAPVVEGDPITATEKTWTWVDFPDTRCMNDTPTGLGVWLNPASENVLIVIQGGGACFNSMTCATVANQNGFDGSALTNNTGGWLSDADTANPFADWNKVFIPYCSGDNFMGAAENGTGYQGRTQVGYLNFHHYLERLVPTFKDRQRVVLSGYSAGGMASTANWPQAIKGFGSGVRVDVLDDSGPLFGEQWLPPCMQKYMLSIWNAKANLPADCTECDADTGHVMVPLTQWVIPRTLARRLGIISSNEDAVIKMFLGFGLNECASLDAPFPPTFPTGEYPKALADLRTQYAAHPGTAMFEIASTNHVWSLQSPSKVTSNGVVLTDWLKDFLDPSASFDDVLPP